MLKCWTSCIVTMFCVIANVFAQEDYAARAKKYIEQYKDLAIAEQKRSGIPAAITLAQGIHETSAGNSELAVNANNHFGIKCKKNWTGETYSYTDDAPNECFRKYPSPEQSYKDHSDYLATAPRYASLFRNSITDYAAWAIGLKQAGYATNPKYAQMLIKLVEEYHLQQYTYAALDNNILENKHVAEVIPEQDAPTPQPAQIKSATTTNKSSRIKVDESPSPVEEASMPEVQMTGEQNSFPPYGQMVKVNGLKAIYAKKGDMPLEYAIKHNVRYERILDINEIEDRPLQSDMYLYLERKRFKGLRPTHIVKPGETLAKIAQYEGVQLRFLKAYNQLHDGEEPAVGAVLYLQQAAPVKPVLAKVVSAPAEPPKAAEPITVEPLAEPAVPQPQFVAKKDIEEAKEESSGVLSPQPDNETAEVQPDIVEAAKEPVGPQQVPEMSKVEKAPVSAEPSVEPLPNLPPAPAGIPETQTSPAVEAVTTVTVDPPVNIANEKAIEEAKAGETKEEEDEEPKDELDALKARFDKVIYTQQPAAPASATEESNTDAIIAEPAPQPQAPPANSAQPGARFYTVKKGDTAFSIAKRHNITMKELMEWNKLDFETIKVGQKLRVKP